MCLVRVLIVDSERSARAILRQDLEAVGHDVFEASCGAEALIRAQAGVDAVIMDTALSDFGGLELLPRLHSAAPEARVVMLSAAPSVPEAVEAMRLGATHYGEKPMDAPLLIALLDRMFEAAPTRARAVLAASTVAEPNDVEQIIGQSPQMQQFKTLLRKVATLQNATVLITGETGTGKDMAARALHNASSRKHGPFMHITCSALPEALLESELFGHERGAFTDAKVQKKGLFELAKDGTVFLDEIGEMSLILQAKLLRFLEEKTFKRVGGSVDIHMDASVVAATNRDLMADVRGQRFREDLYYRLNVMPIEVPPLRNRVGDVPLLVAFYIERFNKELSRNVRGVVPEAMRELQASSWPGNVRELRNHVQRAMLLAEHDVLQLSDFPRPVVAVSTGTGLITLPPRGVDFELLERDLVKQALSLASGNQTRAAVLLGWNRDQIRYRMNKFGLRGPRPVPDATVAKEETRHPDVAHLHAVPANGARA